MSTDKPKRKNTLWDIKIEQTEAVEARAGLVEFNHHKKALLTILRNVYMHGKPVPFDADKSWHRLIRLAHFYFGLEKMKQETMPAADRVKRLRELAKALGRARGMADEAMQDDVGNDLFRAWVAEIKIPPVSVVGVNDDGQSVLVCIADEIKKVVASLAIFETAARRAANEAHKGRGRPKGASVLPLDYIIGLAVLYRDSTGTKPEARRKSFAGFVYAFLAAIGRPTILEDSVVKLVRKARSRGAQ
jgi:hypothetical protein